MQFYCCNCKCSCTACSHLEYADAVWRPYRKLTSSIKEQIAQLSQIDFAMLRVTEYIVRSLEVIQNDTLECGVCNPKLITATQLLYYA